MRLAVTCQPSGVLCQGFPTGWVWHWRVGEQDVVPDFGLS